MSNFQNTLKSAKRPKVNPPRQRIDKSKVVRQTIDEATHSVLSRKLDPTKIYKSGALTPHATPGDAGNTVEGPASISELSRALQNNPQTIFEWVYNNIDWEPGWGLANGAFGTVLSGRGNAFEQCCLLVTLLEAAGYTTNYVLGTIQLSASAAGAWFGTDPTNINSADDYCFYSEIPSQFVWNATENAFDIQIGHVWVQCVIGGTTYLFDPSYKTYTTTAAISNLGTILGYNSSTFLTSAQSGATIDASGNFVQNMNDTNIRANLTTMASNLASWIKTNNPTAGIGDILGGKSIVPITLPVLQTTLSYIVAGATQTLWSGTSGIPLAYKNTMEVSWPEASIDQTFTTDQLAGGRLTIFWDSAGTTPTLYLNGTAVVVGAVVDYDETFPTVNFVFNAYSTFSEDQGNWFALPTGRNVLIGSCFTNQGRGVVDYHQSQLAANRAAGLSASSEPVLGEVLALLWANYQSESSLIYDLGDRYCHTKTGLYVSYAALAYTGSTPTIDHRIVSSITLLLDSTAPGGDNRAEPGYFGYLINGLERAIFEQVTGTVPSVAAESLLRTANNAGLKIYQGTTSNWSSIVAPALTAAGFTSADITHLYDDYVNNGNIIEIPATPHNNVGTYTGYGYSTWPTNGAGGPGGILDSTLNGGSGASNQTPTQLSGNGSENQPNPFDIQFPTTTSDEPIDMLSGNYLHSHTDISVGSQSFPYGLEFKRFYNSSNRYTNASMGLGWTHSYAIKASLNSDGYLPMGQQYALPAVAAIAALYAILDLCTTTTVSQLPLNNHIVAVLCANWSTDQKIQNTVVIQMPQGAQVFTLLPDGSYAPPLNSANKLTLVSGSYLLTTPQGVKMTFNTGGQLTGWIFPSGATVSLTYSSGLLSTISVLGRTLTLGYTSGQITSITDGSRTVHYSYDSNGNLTTFTDANAKVFTYNYDVPGRMNKYFKPQNPTVAFMTNVYDSLGRVKTQSDALGNLWTYYFAGSRSIEVDPLGNSRTRYYNQNGAIIRDINALGFETDYQYDNLGRQVLMKLPEGNSIQWTYDNNNNILTKTWHAKPGSSLSNIVNTYTYDSTWAKIKTFKDGNLNTTTYTYDTLSGNLTTVQRPTVGGIVPTVRYNYNARGQTVSVIDESGLQTQNTYDSSSEKLTKTVSNTNWQAIVGGTITVGNVLTVTAHDALLSGGTRAISYTVKTGDTLTAVASGLAAAINADATLSTAGIYATASSASFTISTAKGNATTFTYSASSGSTETMVLSAGLNLTTNFGYDTAGNTDSIQDANGNTTTSTYDNERRLTQIVASTPFSYITNLVYDYNGNNTSVQKQTGNSTTPWQTISWTFSQSDKKKTFTDPASKVTTWNYDGKDRVKNVIDALSREYQYSYDAIDRLYQVTDPSNTIAETKTYTNNGLLASQKDARNNLTNYSFDGFDRLDKTTYADSSYEENQSYDANGNVLVYRTRSGGTITKTYDSLNRVVTKAPSSQPTVSYNYDAAGRLTSLSKPTVSGDPSSGIFQTLYDTAGRFNQETYPDGKTVTTVLDPNGNATKITYPDGYYVTRKYDQLNRLTNIYLNGSTSAAATFAYDELSRRATLTYSNGVITTYGYASPVIDDLTSVAHAFVGSNVTFSYGYNDDHEINALAISDNSYMWYPATAATTSYGTANSVNEYPTVGGATYQYNGNACLSGDGSWTYTFDTENHLTAASKTGVSASYVYDPRDRQAQKTVGSTKTRYIYSGWQRISDYDGTAGTLQNRYVYGTSMDEPLIQVASSGTVTFYHPDNLGSIVAVSSNAGAVTNKNAYGPFGESAAIAGTTFGYTGQRYDVETGLLYNKWRYYSPSLGRFLSPDPLGYPDGLNSYVYGSNSPLTNTDPMGLSNEWGNKGDWGNNGNWGTHGSWGDGDPSISWGNDPYGNWGDPNPPSPPVTDNKDPDYWILAYRGWIEDGQAGLDQSGEPAGYTYGGGNSETGKAYNGQSQNNPLGPNGRLRDSWRQGRIDKGTGSVSPVYGDKTKLNMRENYKIGKAYQSGPIQNKQGAPGHHLNGLPRGFNSFFSVYGIIGPLAVYQWNYIFNGGRIVET